MAGLEERKGRDPVSNLRGLERFRIVGRGSDVTDTAFIRGAIPLEPLRIGGGDPPGQNGEPGVLRCL